MSMDKLNNTFRQGSFSRFEAIIMRSDGILVDQPDGFPTIEVIYVNKNREVSTAVPVTSMWKIDVGRYFFVWQIPLNQPLLIHQVTYWGWIDGNKVIGEDTFTVLPAEITCMYTPCLLTQIRGFEGSRR